MCCKKLGESLMSWWNSRALRVQDEIELERWGAPDEAKKGIKQEQKNGERNLHQRTRSCFDIKAGTRVFQEDYERVNTSILDPRGQAAGKWNIIFFTAGLVSLFVDPLFFFLPIAQPDFCFDTGQSLQVVLTIARTVYDVFYVLHIAIQFRTAYIAPSSRVFGRGELVIDPWKIAYRYLVKDFWADVMAAIPLPQILVWAILPNLSDSMTSHIRTVLWFTILLQYFLRVALIYPLSSQIVNSTGVMTTEKAWVGAAYNMMLYVLASHLSGAIYYMLTVERQELCWTSVCAQEAGCEYSYFDCNMVGDPGRSDWYQTTNVTSLCNPSSSYYLWGIYQISVQNAATSSSFLHKYFFCLWIGIQALCSIGQTYTSSIFTGETIYCIANSSIGLVLLALLIANMQRYLQSITARLEEWRQKKTDTEQWMHHRQLPHELRQAVRKYGEFKWVATQGVDEEDLLNTLPDDLRREIKRHLCLNLVRQNPLLNQMDNRMLDAICERLKPAFCTKSTFLLLEGDPVDEMFFIIRGHLNSTTTNGGLTGFFNSSSVGPGDFCGEELLSWALDHRHTDMLPLSTRTVEAVSEVEAFSLKAEDLNFVASQFRRLHSRRLIHKFRFYSQQWRTWGACFIQAAWRRHKRRQRGGVGNNKNDMSGRLRRASCSIAEEMNLFVPKPGAGLEVYATRLMNSIRRTRVDMGGDGGSGPIPERPDRFVTDDDEIIGTSSVEGFLFE